jgi:hypothetical protein
MAKGSSLNPKFSAPIRIYIKRTITPVFRSIYPKEVSSLGKLMKKFRKMEKSGIRLIKKKYFPVVQEGGS